MKACINIISSRRNCIKHCLIDLWEKFNNKTNYPVYVYYFDDIYDSENFRKEIVEATPQNIIFKQVPYATPTFIKEEELYYNRHDLWYVRISFPIHRKGYLHMCHFVSNIYGYENTELDQFDYIMIHDDESGYNKEMSFNPFETLENNPDISIGAYFVGQRLKDGDPHQGHLDTRIGFWNFTKQFLLNNNITPASEKLQELMIDEKAEYNFHFIDWCDTYVINNKIFRTELWNRWISAINRHGGIYKYRWGDNEVISMFAHIYQGYIHKFPAIDDGYHDQGKFRHLQDYAPGVKN